MPFNTALMAGSAALLVLAAVPYALPDNSHVERSAVIAAAPEDIFSLLSSNSGFQRFNPFKDTDPDLDIRLTGPEHGVGSGFSFNGKDGSGTQTITAMEENRSVTMKIDLGAMGQPIQRFQLTPVRDGTRVVWGMDASFGLNPIGRIFGLFMDGQLGPVYERGLKNLSRAVAPST